jgi:hypothetical protein
MPIMPRDRPNIGEWNEEEAFAAFQGHVENNDISKDDLMRLRPWHEYPWKTHSCKISLGDAAPDSKVVKLDGSETSLYPLLEADKRPVVLVFGSITCPPFRSMFLKEICDIVGEQKEKVRLLVVYLAEAHPKDGWHLGVNDKHQVVVEEHSTIEKRIASAKALQEMHPYVKEMVTDSIDNSSDHAYEAQSSRIYVIHENKIAYQSELGPFQISPSSLQIFLWEWPVLQEKS